MVAQEGAPSLGGRPGSLDHVLRDALLSDLKAEFEQLAMDARGAPQWIVNAHLPDQSPQARIGLRGSGISTANIAGSRLGVNSAACPQLADADMRPLGWWHAEQAG